MEDTLPVYTEIPTMLDMIPTHLLNIHQLVLTRVSVISLQHDTELSSWDNHT